VIESKHNKRRIGECCLGGAASQIARLELGTETADAKNGTVKVLFFCSFATVSCCRKSFGFNIKAENEEMTVAASQREDSPCVL
jgi:hypothetical protein